MHPVLSCPPDSGLPPHLSWQGKATTQAFAPTCHIHLLIDDADCQINTVIVILYVAENIACECSVTNSV